MKYQFLEANPTHHQPTSSKKKCCGPRDNSKAIHKCFWKTKQSNIRTICCLWSLAQRVFLGDDFRTVSKLVFGRNEFFCWRTQLVEFIGFTLKANEKNIGYSGYRTPRLSDLASPVKIGWFGGLMELWNLDLWKTKIFQFMVQVWFCSDPNCRGWFFPFFGNMLEMLHS